MQANSFLEVKLFFFFFLALVTISQSQETYGCANQRLEGSTNAALHP